MSRKVVITCALTGGADSVSKSPAVPVTPEQIANSAIEAANAGAAVVHIHVRDPETGKASMAQELYSEVVERIRGDGPDMVINLTTGPGARFVPGADWSDRGAKGFQYKDNLTAADGVKIIKVKGGDPGKSKVLLKAANKLSKGLTYMPTGITAELEGDTEATMQLHISDAQCLSTTVTDIKKNDADFFKGKK